MRSRPTAWTFGFADSAWRRPGDEPDTIWMFACGIEAAIWPPAACTVGGIAEAPTPGFITTMKRLTSGEAVGAAVPNGVLPPAPAPPTATAATTKTPARTPTLNLDMTSPLPRTTVHVATSLPLLWALDQWTGRTGTIRRVMNGDNRERATGAEPDPRAQAPEASGRAMRPQRGRHRGIRARSRGPNSLRRSTCARHPARGRQLAESRARARTARPSGE